MLNSLPPSPLLRCIVGLTQSASPFYGSTAMIRVPGPRTAQIRFHPTS